MWLEVKLTVYDHGELKISLKYVLLHVTVIWIFFSITERKRDDSII